MRLVTFLDKQFVNELLSGKTLTNNLGPYVPNTDDLSNSNKVLCLSQNGKVFFYTEPLQSTVQLFRLQPFTTYQTLRSKGKECPVNLSVIRENYNTLKLKHGNKTLVEIDVPADVPTHVAKTFDGTLVSIPCIMPEWVVSTFTPDKDFKGTI